MFYSILGLIVIAYLWIRNRFQFFEKLGFPYVEPSIPFGNINKVGRSEHKCEFITRVYEKYKNKGPAFGIFLLTKPCLMPTDPDLIKDILVKHFDNFNEHGFDIDFEADPLVGHLFAINGQPWKDMRAKLSPAFTSGRMKVVFPILAEIADRMIEYLTPFVKEQKLLEMEEVYASFTTEVISNVAFGLDIKCLGVPDNQFRKMSHEVFHPSFLQNFKFFFMFSFPKISKMFKMVLHSQKTIDFFTKIVRDNLEYREKNNIQRNDFFQLLINIKNSEVGLTFNEIASNCFVFFLAGFETSSSAMTFCTYELALNQDVQDRLRDEIEEVLEKYNGEVTYDAIMEMKYLDMVFNETLRRYPIVDNQTRRSAKEYKIPNTNLVIPAGMQIIIPTVGIHNDERFYENPSKFDPERFSDENMKKIKPLTYFPFSEGPRICLGLRFGIMQTKIGIVKVLKNFKILPCSKTVIPLKFSPNSALQSPEGGLWLKLESIS